MGQSVMKNVASARWTAEMKHEPPPPPSAAASATDAPMVYIEK
jgi:hypothetical protein